MVCRKKVDFCTDGYFHRTNLMREEYIGTNYLTLIGLGFFDMFRFGGGGRMPLSLLSSMFVDLSQRNFVQQLTIKALAQIWKNLQELMTS